jgi:hypothetical protein
MGTPYTQNKVSQAIWSWQGPQSEMQKAKPSLALSLVTLLIGCTVGLLFFLFEYPIMALFVFSISLLVFLSSRFFPAVYAVIEKVLQKLSYFVSSGLTWVLLLPFFYICFPLGRLVQKVKGKDPMQRNFDREAVSYWKTCKDKPSVDDYKRQF